MSVEIVIEGRERTDTAGHHRHRVRVAAEALEEAAHLLVNHRVAGHAVVEVRLLRRRRQFSVQQQVTGLEKVAVLGQLLDRVTPVKQDAFVAIDIGDLGFAARRRGEAGVVGKHPALRVELRNIDDLGTDRAGVYRHIPVVVADRQGAGLIFGAGFGVHGRALELAASDARETLQPGRRDAGLALGVSGRFLRIPSKCALQDSVKSRPAMHIDSLRGLCPL